MTIIQKAFGVGWSRRGEGTQRAVARFQAKLTANEQLPKPTKQSRQVRRRLARKGW